MTKKRIPSQEKLERDLFAIKNNMMFLISFLARDSEHIYEDDAGSVFLEFSPCYIQGFLEMYSFFVRRHGDFCEQNEHIKAGCKIGALFVYNYKKLFASNLATCFVRRDAYWVYATGLLLLFLEELGTDEIVFDDDCVFEKEMLHDFANLVPKDWIERIESLDLVEESVLRISFQVPGHSGESLLMH